MKRSLPLFLIFLFFWNYAAGENKAGYVSDSDSLYFLTESSEIVTGVEETTDFNKPILKNPYKFKGTDLIAPGVLLTAGIIGLESNWGKKINREINDKLQAKPHGDLKIDNITPFIPILGAYGLNLCGIKGKHNLADLTIIYGTTYVLLGVTLFPMKDLIHSERPNHKNFNSFPSGHTAIAFAAAEVLRREYADVSPWIGVGGYLFAVGTGFMRMYNNAHWLSDVLGGAGLGILCAEAAYWLYPAISRTFFKKQYDANIFLSPQVTTRQVGLSCSMTF